MGLVRLYVARIVLAGVLVGVFWLGLGSTAAAKYTDVSDLDSAHDRSSVDLLVKYSVVTDLDRIEEKYATGLPSRIPQLMGQADVPGLSIALIQSGQLVYSGAFGVTNTETNQPVNNETVFAAASLSKPLFAYAVMQLVNRGELELDEPLSRILPHARAAEDERYAQITARMILSHTSGIPHSLGHSAQLLADPGEGFAYSPEAYCYLQRVVEHLTGLSLDEFVSREVFEPLGMSHSSFYFRESYAGNSVWGHGLLGPTVDLSTYARDRQDASCSLLTTAEDYAKLLIAMLEAEGPTRTLIAEMLTPQIQVPTSVSGRPIKDVFWGLGWGLLRNNAGNAFWHWGDLGQFQNYVICFPRTGDGIVYFTNSESGLAIGRELVRECAPDDLHAFDMLEVEDYDAPGWREMRARRKAYLNGEIPAGEGIYYSFLLS